MPAENPATPPDTTVALETPMPDGIDAYDGCDESCGLASMLNAGGTWEGGGFLGRCAGVPHFFWIDSTCAFDDAAPLLTGCDGRVERPVAACAVSADLTCSIPPLFRPEALGW